jgi:hypothetical protein
MMAGGGIPKIIEQGWGATFYGPRDKRWKPRLAQKPVSLRTGSGRN